MLFVKTCCGDEGEMILEEILRHGYDTASKVIIRTYHRLKQASRKCLDDRWMRQLKKVCRRNNTAEYFVVWMPLGMLLQTPNIKKISFIYLVNENVIQYSCLMLTSHVVDRQ